MITTWRSARVVQGKRVLGQLIMFFLKGKVSFKHQIIDLLMNFWIWYRLGITSTKNWGESFCTQVLQLCIGLWSLSLFLSRTFLILHFFCRKKKIVQKYICIIFYLYKTLQRKTSPSFVGSWNFCQMVSNKNQYQNWHIYVYILKTILLITHWYWFYPKLHV